MAGAGGAGFARRPHGCAGQEAQELARVDQISLDLTGFENLSGLLLF